MQHYFINSDNLNLTTREVTIVEDAFHIANVMRMTVGERIVVIAADNSYLVELTNINPKMCVGQIIEELSFDNELKTFHYFNRYLKNHFILVKNVVLIERKNLPCLVVFAVGIISFSLLT